MTYLPPSFEGRPLVSGPLSAVLKVSPQDRLKLMSLPPAQRREHIRFAVLIWAAYGGRLSTLTFHQQLEILKIINRVLRK